MMNFIEFGDVLGVLERRFRALTDDQRHVYHDRLKMTDKAVLKEAIEHLVDTSKNFPTPGEIKMAVREMYAKRASQGRPVMKEFGCPQCDHGYVHYEILRGSKYKHFIGDCAFCHNGEITIQPQVVQIDDRILFACEKFSDMGIIRYRANPDVQEPYAEAVPLRSNRELRDYFDSPRMIPPSGGIQKIVEDTDLDLPF